MSVSVVKKIMGVAASRQREETKIIFRHKTLKPQGINVDLDIYVRFLFQNLSL